MREELIRLPKELAEVEIIELDERLDMAVDPLAFSPAYQNEPCPQPACEQCICC